MRTSTVRAEPFGKPVLSPSPASSEEGTREINIGGRSGSSFQGLARRSRSGAYGSDYAQGEHARAECKGSEAESARLGQGCHHYSHCACYGAADAEGYCC
jgi:hypothetical protein